MTINVLDVTSAESVYLSPSVVYHLDASAWLPFNCEGDSSPTCATKLAFQIGDDNPCNYTVVCPRMEGGGCATFGININDGDGALPARACHANEAHRGTLRPERDLEMDLWIAAVDARNRRARDLECYLWCTETGELPRTPVDKTSEYQDLISSLVREAKHLRLTHLRLKRLQLNGTRDIRMVELSDVDVVGNVSTSSPIALSPHTVYAFSEKYSLGKETEEGSLAVTFKWTREEPCVAHLVCPRYDY